MGFFQNLFHTPKPAKSVLLIDIGAHSVAGAYASYEEGRKSALLYTRRLPIFGGDIEPRERAVVRTLVELGNALIREGAPTLMRTTGHGTAESVLVSIGAPWQEIQMRTKHITQEEPFLFTRQLVDAALELSDDAPIKLFANESIVGTVLNGYETRDPYGKKAVRASIVTLTSHIDRSVSENIIAALRGLFHTGRISLIAANSLRYQAVRGAFTHERNAYILDATGPSLFLSVVHKDVLASITEIANAGIMDEIKKLRERFGPPRTTFLLASESEDSSLRQALAGTGARNIVSIRPAHLAGFVTHAAATPPDTNLMLMALYPQTRLI